MRTAIFILGIMFLEILQLHWEVAVFSQSDRFTIGVIAGGCVLLDIVKK